MKNQERVMYLLKTSNKCIPSSYSHKRVFITDSIVEILHKHAY